MKKLLLVCIALTLTASLTACSGQKKATSDSPDNVTKEAQEMKKEADKQKVGEKLVWPKEAQALGVPELKKGKISSVGINPDNKAIAIAYSGLKRDDIEEYKKLLEKEGFSVGQEYPSNIWNYVNNKADGTKDITFSFEEDNGESSVVILNKSKNVDNSDADSASQSGNQKWVDTIPKEVPVFSKGAIIKSFEAGPVTTMKFKDVEKESVEAYEKALIAAGFEYDKDDSSNISSQYEKIDQAKMSAIIIDLEYKDGNLTLSIGKA